MRDSKKQIQWSQHFAANQRNIISCTIKHILFKRRLSNNAYCNDGNINNNNYKLKHSFFFIEQDIGWSVSKQHEETLVFKSAIWNTRSSQLKTKDTHKTYGQCLSGTRRSLTENIEIQKEDTHKQTVSVYTT